MKFALFVQAALLMAIGSATNSEARRLGGRQRCDYKCPTNSYRKPNRQCYDTFNDCECDDGYYKSGEHCVKDLELTINNLSFQQPFSSFFVMVHNDVAQPLYRQGQEASKELAILAEDGNPDALVQYYQKQHGVFKVFRVDGPLLPSERTTIKVQVNDDYELVTLATMAINTNDCFTAVNGVQLEQGDVLDLPGLDAGSEENNELCSSIPGPACSPDSGNVRSGNGEGFVHVHRGFHGINEGKHLPKQDRGANNQPLSAVGYDWRNPMMRVTVN